MTHSTASIIFDLPQPLGPTTLTRLPGIVSVIGSTKDLNPASLILRSRMGRYNTKIKRYKQAKQRTIININKLL